MKRLVLFVLVSVLGLCNSALTRPMAYTPPAMYNKNGAEVKKEGPNNQIVCSGDKYTKKDFEPFYVVGNENYNYDKGFIKCWYEVNPKKSNKMGIHCNSSVFTPHNLGSSSELYKKHELHNKILEVPYELFKEYYQSIFDSGACKVLDKDLKDITPRTKDTSKEEVKEVKVKEDFDEEGNYLGDYETWEGRHYVNKKGKDKK